MNRKFWFAVSIIALAMVSLFMVASFPVQAAQPLPDYRPVDVGPQLRELTPSDVTLHMNGFENAYADAASSGTELPDFYGEGDIITAIWYDDTAGLYLADYEVKAIGDHIEVWVMTDLDFPEGDPRNPVVVTDEQIAYLVDQFDNNIYPRSRTYMISLSLNY